MHNAAINVVSLARNFGSFTAVRDVYFQVPNGAFFGFLGPNGSGKSTTIKMLTGLLKPTAGSIKILGYDVGCDTLEVKRRIGVVGENLNTFGRLTGSEYLTLVSRLHGLGSKESQHRQEELCLLLALKPRSNGLIEEYSTGMKKKLALAAALISGPQVLFLDEPFEGVDVVTARTIKEILASIREQGTTIFLTSHILDIVESLCTDIAILNHGTIAVTGSLIELKQSLPENTTLEDYFVSVVGGGNSERSRLSWMS